MPEVALQPVRLESGSKHFPREQSLIGHSETTRGILRHQGNLILSHFEILPCRCGRQTHSTKRDFG